MASNELRLVVAADGFGSSLKDAVVAHLNQKKYNVEDLGTDKYYESAKKVARTVQASGRNAGDVEKPETVRGILFCGSGMGVAITANKYQVDYYCIFLMEKVQINRFPGNIYLKVLNPFW